jgi:HSP20 family molecular chaperone IbpA
LFQNVALGNLSPRDIVISWIVDDGNATKQHRDCLFDAANSVVGISSGPHMRFARVTVVATAGSYREASAAAAQEGTVAAVQVIPPDAPEVQAETEVVVGPFEERKDAFYIDITNLGCPAKALKLRLEKQGIELVVRRKVTVGGQIREFAQRMALPFPFQPSQISASYSVGIGKLALELKKASASAAPTAGAAASGEVGRFRVAADSSKTNDKIAVQPAQTSDHFAFSCDSSKYDTDVVVSLEGRKLSFAAQYSFDTVVDGEEVVKTVKANSAFTLPFDATMAQIELVPNGTKGSTVKVYKVAPAGASSGASAIIDTDINILSKS